MKGQWLGFFGGDLNGPMMVEVDERRRFQDVACYFRVFDTHYNSHNDRILYFRGFCEHGPDAELNVPLWSRIGSTTPGPATRPSTINIRFRVQEPELVVSFGLETGERCSAMLLRSRADRDSELASKRMSWAEFEAHVRGLEPRRYIFRGQENSKWRLRTSYHRSGRSNMMRYIQDDVTMMHRSVIDIVPEFTDIDDRVRYAAFLTLAQHHGFPTPLLDWTKSPFVAAFFAFQNDQSKTCDPQDESYVRIFKFDEEAWLAAGLSVGDIAPRMPHFSLVYPLALSNPRLMPQQGLIAVTNLDDIESYLAVQEQNGGVNCMEAIDIPITERKEALKQLEFMGVTAGSLFPGLDGAFAALRAIRFG
jgi:hypothetical protein